jgi:hypothetical protein
MTMTPLDAYDRLAASLDCLTRWDQTIDALQPAAELIDLDTIARALCLLDATTRTALRGLELTIVPSESPVFRE